MARNLSQVDTHFDPVEHEPQEDVTDDCEQHQQHYQQRQQHYQHSTVAVDTDDFLAQFQCRSRITKSSSSSTCASWYRPQEYNTLLPTNANQRQLLLTANTNQRDKTKKKTNQAADSTALFSFSYPLVRPFRSTVASSADSFTTSSVLLASCQTNGNAHIWDYHSPRFDEPVLALRRVYDSSSGPNSSIMTWINFSLIYGHNGTIPRRKFRLQSIRAPVLIPPQESKL